MSFGVRVFDTVLDGRKIKDTSSRNAADFWKAFCLVSGWSFSFERVHSLADFSYFMNRKIKESVIIFSGHGNEDGWHMTNGEVLNENNIGGIHPDNVGKDIIFSSCLMATNIQLCKALKLQLSAKRLFAYQHIMQDRFCYINESILLSLVAKKIAKNTNFTAADFNKFMDDTVFLKNLNRKYVRPHPMLMF